VTVQVNFASSCGLMEVPAIGAQLFEANRQYYRALLPSHISYHLDEAGREFLYDSRLDRTRWLWERRKLPNPAAADAGRSLTVYVNCVDGRRAPAPPIFRPGAKQDGDGSGKSLSKTETTCLAAGGLAEAVTQRERTGSRDNRLQAQPAGPKLQATAPKVSEKAGISLGNHAFLPKAMTGTRVPDRRGIADMPQRPAAHPLGMTPLQAASALSGNDAAIYPLETQLGNHHLRAGWDPVSPDTLLRHQSGSPMHTPGAHAEASRRRARAERFREHLKCGQRLEASQLIVSKDNSRASLQQTDAHAHRLVGTSAVLEKTYLRLTKEAQADQVRPLSVLETAFAQLMSRWEHGSIDYTFLREQLKAIRQDMQVQGLGAEHRLAFDVYETHARLAIFHDDVAELSQCLSMLKSLFQASRSEYRSNQREFLSYSVLLALYTGSLLDVRLILRDEDLLGDAAAEIVAESSAASDTIDLWSTTVQLVLALARHDYFSFMRIRKRLPPTARHLVSWFDTRIVQQVLNAVQSAYRPSVPLGFIEELVDLNPEDTSIPERRSPHRASVKQHRNSTLHPERCSSLEQILTLSGAQVSADGQALICNRRPPAQTQIKPQSAPANAPSPRNLSSE